MTNNLPITFVSIVNPAELKALLEKGVVVFTFNKVNNGGKRLAVGTLNEALLKKLCITETEYLAVETFRSRVAVGTDPHKNPTEVKQENERMDNVTKVLVNNAVATYKPKRVMPVVDTVLKYYDLQKGSFRSFSFTGNAEIEIISSPNTEE